MGTGDANLSMPTYYPGAPVAVATADLTGDSAIDVLGVGVGTVFLVGDGSGFFSRRDAPVGDHASNALALADLNGDGALDVVRALGDGGIEVDLDVVGTRPANASFYGDVDVRGLATADLDGDSNVDIAYGDYTRGHIIVMFGDGHGGFTQNGELSTPAGPFSIALADLNGDALVDIASANLGISIGSPGAGDTASVLLNRGGRMFSPSVEYPAGHAPVAIAASDVDRDGNMDLVVAAQEAIHILRGRGDGTFEDGIFHGTRIPIARMKVADLNGDSIPDVCLTHTTKTLGTMMIGPGLSFGDEAEYALRDYPWDLTVTDFDANGVADIAVAMPGSALLIP